MSTGKKWYQGHCGRFWDQVGYKEFPYIKQSVTTEEVNEWISKGYDHVKSYTGEMYDNQNLMPAWTETFKELLDFNNLTFTFYKMSTLEIMPVRVDDFTTYNRLTNAKSENVFRILIMLEDWKPGHYLEIDGTGIVNWVAGDYFVWEHDVPHAASNIGIEPRYTLQITGTKSEGTDIWRKLHWFNIPNLPSKKESVTDLYMFHINAQCFSNSKSPYFIYMYNNRITELDDINHDEPTIEYLNQVGLDFYLYEPLCSYMLGATQYRPPYGTKHDRVFYSEFIGNEDYEFIRADELDTILDYVNRNKLNNVTVHSCDYNVEKYYPYYCDKFDIMGDDLYMKTARPINVQNKDFQSQFTKKFICANWRYAPHRHLLAAAVSPLSGYTSFYYKSDFSTIQTGKWYNFLDWKVNDRTWAVDKMIVGTLYINRNAPLNIDLDIKEAKLIDDAYFINGLHNSTLYVKNKEVIDNNNNALEKFYSDIFCDVVTESRFAQPTANYSEKVFQPMWYKKPFILAAPPYTLQVLRDEGFKTFSDFWDESYDECEIHEERILKLLKVIECIDDHSIEELKEMYEKMKPILLHNYNLVKEKLHIEK
jgi:hypothetical protein